jgi:hypothetical protein
VVEISFSPDESNNSLAPSLAILSIGCQSLAESKLDSFQSHPLQDIIKTP